MEIPQPHDPAAEQQVLGAVLLDQDCLDRLKLDLETEQFCELRNRVIWVAMCNLRLRGAPIDLVTLIEELKQAGDLEKAGGAHYVAELLDCVATSETAPYYAKRVKVHAELRHRAQDLAAVISRITPSSSPEEIDTEVYRLLEAGARNRSADCPIITMAQAAERYHLQVIDKQSRFKFGFDCLDAVIGGVRPGETLFICAYSATYKSALLQYLLLNGCSMTSLHHLFFSMEMPVERVFERTVQMTQSRYTYNIESEFHHHDPEKRAETMLQLANAEATKLLTVEEGGLSLERVEHYTRVARAKYGQLGAIGLDYLGLMDAPGTRGEYERISAVAEGCKMLAKRLKIPVIVLTQINRSAAAAGEMEMHSSKGSGAIEASADYLLGLQRTKEGDILLKLLKNRGGEAGLTFKANISKPFLRFDSIEPYDSLSEKNVTRGNERKAKLARINHWQEDLNDDPYP